jgi:hypothetical protein
MNSRLKSSTVMSELFEAVEKRLLKEKDQDETVTLWRKIWACYAQDGLDGVQELMDGLLMVPEEDK